MNRARLIGDALRAIAPKAPANDLDNVLDHALHAKGLRHASPEAAAWLSLVAFVRHNFSAYDAMLAEGYERDEARFFSLQETNAQLIAWGCRLKAGETESDIGNKAGDKSGM